MTSIDVDFDFTNVFCNVKLAEIAKVIAETSKDYGVRTRFTADLLERTAELTFTSVDGVEFSYGIMMALFENVRKAFVDVHCVCPVKRVSSF